MIFKKLEKIGQALYEGYVSQWAVLMSLNVFA
jgi:hypothetical protein